MSLNHEKTSSYRGEMTTKNDSNEVNSSIPLKESAIIQNELSTQAQQPPTLCTRPAARNMNSDMKQQDATPATTAKRSFGHLDTITPVFGCSSGPLKKRIKQRYSLGAESLSPFTPSEFFNLTPEVLSLKEKDTPRSCNVRLCPLRLPFANISLNTLPQSGNGKSESSDSLIGGLDSSLNRKQTYNLDRRVRATLRDAAISTLPKVPAVATKKVNSNRSIDFRTKGKSIGSLGSKLKIKKLDQLHRPTQVTISTPLGAPHLPTKLPFLSPISTLGSEGDRGFSSRKKVSFDDETPSSYMCFVRKQLEFFQSTQEVVDVCKARDVPVSFGQVVLRCRHCKCIPFTYRPKGSITVAKLHTSLYKYFNSGMRSHLELCPFVPRDTKKTLKRLRETKLGRCEKSAWEGFGYWCALANAKGVVETDRGLRFQSTSFKAKVAVNLNANLKNNVFLRK